MSEPSCSAEGRLKAGCSQDWLPHKAAHIFIIRLRRSWRVQLMPRLTYQTRHAFWLTMGWSALHENAFWNSGEFCSVPFTR